MTALNVDRVGSNRVYDSFGLVSESSGLGQPTTQVTYTALDRPSSRTLLAVDAIAESSSSSSYDSANGSLLVSALDRAGNLSTARYGVDFQVEESIAPLNSDSLGTGAEKKTNTIYDSLGRPVAVVDESGARQAIAYDVLDRVIVRYEADHPFTAGTGSIDPSSEVGVQRTTYTQYSQPESITGASVYPIFFSYDAEGNRIAMTDNKGSALPGADFANGTTTRWDYDERDRVVRKRYAYQSETVFGDDYSYDYLPNNLLSSMTDGEGHLISYAYEPSRNLLLKIDYPTDEDIVFGEVQADFSIVTGYDKAHRPTRYQDETGVCTMSYDALGRPHVTTQGNVSYEQVTTYDAWSRASLMRCRPAGASDGDPLEWTCSYSYDVAGRLETLTDSQVSANPFTYDYHPRANLIGSLTHPNGLATTKSWDARGILSEVTTRDNAANILKSHQYGLNALRQRETITREDGAELTFGYDQQRQVIDGEKTSAGSSFPAYDYAFGFDEIGNRESADDGTHILSYTANAENQYTAIDSVSPAYDDNGSLLTDGRITLEWQERNRLDRVTDDATGKSSHYRYDALGRRLEREDYEAGGALTKVTRYLYHGWNCVAEFETTTANAAPASFARTKTYTWGLDLSETMQGAGGVGGLCAITDEQGPSDITYHYVSDGNGNVVGLYDDLFAAVAEYEYSPFGELITQSGVYSSANTYRFSTKPQNDHAGELYYYGYRYYDPVTGRWPSRDPIEESGGLNLYGFTVNDGVNRWDLLGLRIPGDHEISVVSKSYIEGIPRVFRPGSSDVNKNRLLVTSWLLFSRLDAFDQSATSDSKDGLYRLYSRVKVSFRCCDGKIVNEYVGNDKEGGVEIEIGSVAIAGTINQRTDLNKISDSTIRVVWGGWGSPHIAAEPGMQLQGLRTSTNIWHGGAIDFTCSDDDTAKSSIVDFKGSRFPSHKLWIDGKLSGVIRQEYLSDLWVSHPSNPSFVR